MAYRALKNENGVIIAIGTDEGQSGEDAHMPGVWCDWTFDEIPAYSALPGLDKALYFKENETEDGIELRTEEEVENSPNE